ncbi:MAG TPA: DNA polymerase III subunit beta [Gemmataceae bacterium]|nr:DNA polymerase III subunit beta [Gemmataceae bacterium]
MKALCHREGLLAACQLASVATATRDVKPVLKSLKAIVEPERCTLMATDLEIGIRLEVRSVRVEEPGEAILPTTKLISILREATDEELTIEAGPDTCIVRGQFNEFEMPGEDPAIFPDVPAFAEEKYHEMSAGVLREMIRRTAFATAAEPAKFGATTGVLWELEDGKARLVATDGRRLALTEGLATAHGGHSTKGQAPVVPAKAMSLLERNLQEEDELVQVSLRPNEVLIKTERAMIYSRLVEGRFPDYRRVIPQKASAKIPLTVGPFHTAVKQAAIMTDDKESKRVVFTFAKKKLTLEARGPASGRSHVELPLEYDGKSIEISFDPKYLTEMLRVLDPEAHLTLELEDGGKPALFKNETGDYQYVVVPLVVKE